MSASADAFRAALEAVPAGKRDAWVDAALELDGVAPDDATALPRGCVPYLPAPVEKLLQIVDGARITANDVFVDVGAGVGRAAVIVHLLTGAHAIGLEVQPALAAAARAIAMRTCAEHVTILEGDAATTAVQAASGTVFFLYCPFSGERLARLLADLATIARRHPIRVCCLDLPLPECGWLERTAQPSGDVEIYGSVTTLGVGR